MDFRSQDARQAQAAAQTTTQTTAQANSGNHRKVNKYSKGLRFASIALLFSATILVVALVLYVVFGGPKNEQEYVDKTKYQAVFLNGGQVYFGHIQNLNEKYIKLSDIYYLSVSQQVQPDQKDKNNQSNQQQNITLVRLGCELHRPQNSMIVNREQVIFWENLKDDDSDTTVPGAIKKYVAANPNGQTCETPNASNNTNSKKP